MGLLLLGGFVFQYVPACQAGDDHLFRQVAQLVDDDVVLPLIGGDEQVDAVGAGAVELHPFQGDDSVLEEH